MKAPTISDILAGRGGAYFRVERAPDARAAFVLAAMEMRMSHWVEHAALYALPEERLIAEIGSSLWSVDKTVWAADGKSASLDLRRYPGDIAGATVTIDIAHGQASVDGGDPMPLAQLSDWLESDYRRRGGRG